MAETIKKGVIKKKTDANNTVVLYPKTTADQIEYESKTYTSLIGTSNNWIGCNFYFIEAKPTSWQAEWSVKFRLECELDAGLSPTNGQYMHSTHECFIAGSRGLFNTYAIFNNINHTSYRVIGYGILAKTTEAGFNNNYGHMLGISLYYNGLAYENQNANYKRTIKVTILETVNCTATLKDAPLISHNATRTDYTKLNSTYYPYSSSESNTAGYLSTWDTYTNGLRETSDDNTTDQIYYHTQWTTINPNSNVKLPGYAVFGFDTAGNIQPIANKSSSQTTGEAAINTASIYNTTGFDWSRGLLRWVSNGLWAAGSTNLTHAYKVITFDFRYTDNLINAANTTLTMTANKYVYLRGTIGSDGLFYLAPWTVTYNGSTYKRVWTQDVPTTEDGYVYWLIGHAYGGGSATVNVQDVRLYTENPLYWFKDGKFREYLQNSNIQNGTGTNAVRQKMADATVNFSGRNPNAEAIDSSLSATFNTGASGSQSAAFGKNTMALSTAAFTNGNKTLAKGEESHAEGYQSVTLGDGSHAEGARTTAVGLQSHSEGADTIANGEASHAEGHGTTADDYYAHAEGEDTIAEGYASHAEGTSTRAVGTCSHAEGSTTTANANFSHTMGTGTYAGNESMLVVGKYNEHKSNTLFVVGNGTSDSARSNAFEVYSDGHAEVDLMGSTNLSVATKQYVDNNNTKNTAGSTNDTSLLYLVGAKTQAANPQTYSRNNTYINANGVLVNTTGFSSYSYAASSINGLLNIGTNVVNYYSSSGPASFKATSSTHGSWQIGDNSGNIYLQKTGGSSSSGNAYLLFPNVGTSSVPKTLATTDDLTGKVSKTGDTMTGDLQLNVGSGYSSSPNLVFVNQNGNGYLYKNNTNLILNHVGTLSYTLTFPAKDGTLATTNDLPQILDYRS